MNEEQGFKVTDKRGFQEDGTSRPSGQEPAKQKTEQKQDAQQAQDAGLPTIDFPSYVLSYYTQGMVLLGEVPNPYTNKKEEDVDAARHIIDILSMLEEKTKGNLSEDESNLMGSVLYELRMKFMAKTSRMKF